MTTSALLRRTLLATSLALAAGASLAQAPAWPSKTVKIVNPFPPGGPSDLIARSVADVLGQQTRQPFIVENKAGAAGNIGTDQVAKSPADGYTVLMGIDTTFTVNPHIYKAMPFKPADLRPVMVMASSGMAVAVNPSTGLKSFKDLVALGKAKGVNFSSAGSGSPGHLAAEIASETGMKINHIPYKGNTPAITAILANEVDGGILASPGMIPHIRAGKLTPLAVTSRQRTPLLPEVPTVAEVGMPQLEQEVLYVAMVPAATPEPVVQALQKALAEALAKPDVRARLEANDLRHEGAVGAAAAKRLADLNARYGKVIAATGMKVE